MPRRNRIHYQHALYHVILRGNNRQKIFYDDKDRNCFLELMKKATDRFNCMIHLYCLMDNHVHVVIEIEHIPLAKIMQSISATYANKFNRRHGCVGHVFQGRYRAKVIHDSNYLIELCYYIHMNPVKAGITNDIDLYPWSSHSIYMKKKTCSWLTIDRILRLLEFYATPDEDAYTQLIYNKELFYKESRYCTFTESGELNILTSDKNDIRTSEFLALENIPLSKISKIICDYLDIPLMKLNSPSYTHTLTTARALITYFAHYHGKHTLTDIGALLNRQPNSLSKSLKRNQFNKDSLFNKAVKVLYKKLSISDVDKLL